MAVWILIGELDALISQLPHSHLITCPVFGAPAAADKSQLILVMSGDYRSKKEVAYLLVPAVGRKVVDLGGNVEKGGSSVFYFLCYLNLFGESALKAPTLKLIGNSMILGCMEVVAECQTLAEKSGIGAEAVHNFVKGNININSITDFIQFNHLIFTDASDVLPAGPYVIYSPQIC